MLQLYASPALRSAGGSSMSSQTREATGVVRVSRIFQGCHIPGNCWACNLAGQEHAWRSAPLSVTVKDDDGASVNLVGEVCRPATDARAPVIVINHGSPPSARGRPLEAMADCDDEAPTWFLKRGFVVVQVLRRGYGESGGNWAESYGRCLDPDFVAAGLETARDIKATVDVATSLPYVDAKNVVVLGQSAGAWGVLAFASLDDPDIAALIAMAPGRGGHRDGIANLNCRPDRLIEAAGRYGGTARSNVLWVNTRNDSYFAPNLVLQMQKAFTQAGGKVTVAHLGAYDDDGHHLFFGDGGSVMWGPVIATYLAHQNVPVVLPK